MQEVRKVPSILRDLEREGNVSPPARWMMGLAGASWGEQAAGCAGFGGGGCGVGFVGDGSEKRDFCSGVC